MSDETVAVPVALLRELREFGVECWTIPPWQIKDIIALIPPPPWEPSDEDVLAYCGARGWHAMAGDRAGARRELIGARERGWDAVPRRLDVDGSGLPSQGKSATSTNVTGVTNGPGPSSPCKHIFDRILFGGGLACTRCDDVQPSPREFTDEEAAAFYATQWPASVSPMETYVEGHQCLDRLTAAGWRIEPPEEK